MNDISKITLVGAGQMGAALVGGWLKAGLGGRIEIVTPRPSELVQGWADAGEVRLILRQAQDEVIAAADVLVIAVKPQVFGRVVDGLVARIGPQTQVLSVMAGVSLATLVDRLGTDKIARAMPNTPGLIGLGVTLLCLPEDAGEEVEARMRGLLEPLGAVEGPIGEDLLPAATAVSGCGPAYVFLLAEMMAAAGVAHGLDAALAMRLARGTVAGAGALMAASQEEAGTLRKNVTSPNGVTQAALEVLMAGDAMPSIFTQAVRAAIARDAALAAETG